MPNDRTDVAALAARLDAVERALTDETRTAPRPDADSGPETTASESPSEEDDADGAADDAPDDAVRRLERRVEALAAELDAVRGLLGGVEAVNESVERRADLALAAAERARDERGADGLLVERLPEADAVEGSASAATADADAVPGDGSTDSDSNSLAARLREAL